MTDDADATAQRPARQPPRAHRKDCQNSNDLAREAVGCMGLLACCLSMREIKSKNNDLRYELLYLFWNVTFIQTLPVAISHMVSRMSFIFSYVIQNCLHLESKPLLMNRIS